MEGERASIHTLTKSALCGCTVRIASVLPCKNAFVIAGSYVHSILPTTQSNQTTISTHPIQNKSGEKETYHTTQTTPPETPSAQTHPD